MTPKETKEELAARLKQALFGKQSEPKDATRIKAQPLFWHVRWKQEQMKTHCARQRLYRFPWYAVLS
jgi:hypothetical protein